jgi:HD-like signal output (HDOD) protein
MIAKRELGQRGGNLYAAGLVRDMGIIVEDQFLGDRFQKILAKSKTERKSLSQTEHRILGYNHAQMGMAIADDWHLPKELGMTMGYHHDPDGAPRTDRRLAFLLYVADYVCQDRGIGYGDESFEDEALFRRSLRELKIESRSLDLMFKDVKWEVSKMKAQGLV